MECPLLDRFRQHYHGRFDPGDALHWVHHPDEPGPSSAPPPQQVYLAAAEELTAAGHPDLATALLTAALEALAADRQAALDALRAVQRTHEG